MSSSQPFIQPSPLHDDGTTEADFFGEYGDYGPSSTCYPRMTFSYLGDTDEPFDPANVGNASDGPGLEGVGNEFVAVLVFIPVESETLDTVAPRVTVPPVGRQHAPDIEEQRGDLSHGAPPAKPPSPAPGRLRG